MRSHCDAIARGKRRARAEDGANAADKLADCITRWAVVAVRTSLTALGSAILTPHDNDRPDPDDPMVQAIAIEYGLSAEYVANTAEETALTIFTRTGERAPLEDVLATMHAVLHDARKAKEKRRR